MPAFLLTGLLSALLVLSLGACTFDSLGISGGNSSPPDADPFYGADEGIPLAKGLGTTFYRTDLEDQAADCWGNRLASGFAAAPCGHWGAIGPATAQLAVGRTRHSGLQALEVTFDRNEGRAGATLSLSADVVNVRAWYNFSEGFDFGQGIKVGRVRSFDHAAQANAIDIILAVRSSGDADQCGLTDMADLGLFYNGRPVGNDWGRLIAPVRFERGKWHAVEYQVALNTPGAKDGSVTLWVDGRLQGTRQGLDIRGRAGAGAKLNKITLGGWYSNGAHGNPCADPSQPSTVFIDDVAVGSKYIGLE